MSRQFAIESLENRTLLSAAQISFPNFSSSQHLVGNGFGASPMTVAGKLELTDNQFYTARSVWYDTTVPVGIFRTEFTFQSNKNTVGADGLTFTIQNGPTSTLGSDGRDLGYGKTTNLKSVAIAFDQYNFRHFGSKFGFAVNGEKPPTLTPMGSIDLHSGHAFHVTVIYNGKTLGVSVIDTTDSSKVFTANEKINLGAVLGTTKAIVGFTGATGANRSTQDVLNWTYTAQPAVAPPAATPPTAPSIAHVAAASPSPSNGTSTVLTILGSDQHDAEKRLTYTWRALQVPAGAHTPTFSKNGANSAKSTVAHFSKDGIYTFQAVVTNTAGLSAVSNVRVRVNEVSTAVALSPHEAKLKVGRRQVFSAVMLDQFNHPMRTQPTFTYAMVSGGGAVNRRTGMFTAPSSVDHEILGATADGVTGTVGVTIYPLEDRPTIGA